MRSPVPTYVLWLAVTVLVFVQAVVAARFPSDVGEARQDYSRRRDSALEAYVHLTSTEPLLFKKCDWKWKCSIKSHPLGSFAHHGSTQSFRRMAAWLIAYKKYHNFSGDYGNNIPKPPNLIDAPTLIKTWIDSIKKYARAGTYTNGGAADYDMVLKEMVTFLYLFKDEPTLLNNDAAFNVIHKGLLIRGNDWGSHMSFKITLWATYPETENHVLMTLSSMYLTNQWIYNNPRNDSRLTKGAYKKRSSFKNSDSFRDILLQAMGRIVHSDYFETNPRPYQVFTLHSLFKLYAFADDPIIRSAAKNAIDFTLTKFAFQSFEGKRLTPQQRQSSHRESMSINENDGTVFVMGMLSGYYSWNDTVKLVPDTGKLDKVSYFPATYSGNSLGHMLWAALFQDPNLLGTRKYTVPLPIHDFMLRKRKAYWARMQARFSGRNYAKHHHPRYFAENSTQIWTDGRFEFAPELYYGTSHVLNVAGGRWNNYPLQGIGDPYMYDFTGKPSYIMPHGHVQDWGEGPKLMGNDTLLTTTGAGGDANNLGTYKGFTWGYQKVKKPAKAQLLQETFIMPSLWTPSADFLIRGNGTSAVRFRFYDRTSYQQERPPTWFYVVSGGLKIIRASTGVYLARGFWEVVPASRFASLHALQRYVLKSNSMGSLFEPTSPFVTYKSTTGEILKLHQDAGLVNVAGIASIVHPNGRKLNASDVYIDLAENGKRMPLIDVTEVNEKGLLTGVKYAYSQGNGLVLVNNPFVKGKEGQLCIDSTNYRNPFQGCV